MSIRDMLSNIFGPGVDTLKTSKQPVDYSTPKLISVSPLKSPTYFKNENLYNTELLFVAKKYSLPYATLKGLCALESEGFIARSYRAEPAINDASYGLMQLLMGTARGLGYSGDAEGLYNPQVSLDLGAKFLKQLVDKYSSMPDAIASYNMGYPRPASKTTPHIIELYGKPDATWIYANQPYVDRVMAYATFYQVKDINHDQTLANEIYAQIRARELKLVLARGIPIAAVLAGMAILGDVL